MKDKDIKHLEWVYERMKYVHNENEDSDYMIRFRKILEALRQPAVSSSALAKVEQYNQLKKEMQEEILHLKTIIDDLSYLFNIGTVEERKELQGKISKLEWAVYQMKHCC